jgi:Tfp pilus assembly ATPase PilU
MQTFDQSIFGLYERGLVSYEEALRWATDVDELKLRAQAMAATSDIRGQMAEAALAKPDIIRFGS